jgi:DNA-binding GntR family transcriptional regulator
MIERSTLRAQLATALRDEILAARLPTGSHFTVKEIAEQYGVSATPVREALVDLAAQGLLDVEQHRGFRVHEFTADDYRAMVESRTLVLDGLFRRDAVTEDCDACAEAMAEAEAEAEGETKASAGAPAKAEAEGEAAEAALVKSEPRAEPEAASEAGTNPEAAPKAAPEGARDSASTLAPALLASVRRRADAADRAARAGDLDVLIGYDLRYWRELSAIVGNPYICDFLHRIRVQSWVFAVPGLRREREVARKLWSRNRELVDAVERWDTGAARSLIAAYHRHSLLILGKSSAARLLP